MDIPLFPSVYDYEPTQFVARKQELQLVGEKVRRATLGEPIARPLVEIVSVAGQGKSWLLNRIREEYFAEGDRHPLCLVDLQNVADESQLLACLAAQLRNVGLLTEQREADDVRQWADRLRSAAEKGVPVLLFDHADRARPDLLDWLEANFIRHAIRSDRVLFVFASRSRLRWKQFEVRRRVELIELGPLDDAASQQQVGQLPGAEALAPKAQQQLLACSFGHPLTIRSVYETVRRLPTAFQNNDQAPAISKAVQQLVDRHFLAAIDKPELRDLLWDTCILRKLNVEPLRRFDNHMGEERSEAYYLEALRAWVIGTLVQWRADEGGYVLDPTVRQIMAHNLRMRDPDEFRRRHQQAVQMYDEWIQFYPRSAGGFLIERIYHQAQIEPDQVQAVFSAQLQKFEHASQFSWDLPDIAAALDERLSALEKSATDTEKEFVSTVGSPTVKALRNQAQSFIKDNRILT